MDNHWINQIETPCIVVDMKKVRQNIQTMQAAANRGNCELRPHIKTHKSAEIARLQVAAGASGITCAKVSEAEVMADGGLDDIFIAYPLWGDTKLERAVRLHKRVKRLILGVDSYACAEQLSRIAFRHQVTLELRLEIDTGAKRTGTPHGEAVSLAKAIAALKNVSLTGLYTFKSLILNGEPTTDRKAAAREECEILYDLRRRMTSEGLNIRKISAGSTPTAAACAETGLLDEIRPGTYVFNDQMTYRAGVCEYEDIAARIYATVVSVPDARFAVLDGGSKVFPTDIPLHRDPFNFHAYAYVPGRDGLILDRLSEEHGILSIREGETSLHAGEILQLVPVHICTAVNMRDYIYAYEDGQIRKLRVDARGMSV